MIGIPNNLATNQRDATAWVQQTLQQNLSAHGVPEAVQQDHVLYFMREPADDPIKHKFIIICRCKWAWRHECYELTTVSPDLHDALDSHAKEIIDTFRPTLREMTEWGWFQPEPDDPDPLYPVFFGWDWGSKPSYTARWIGGWPVNPP